MERSWVDRIRRSRLGKFVLGGSVIGVAAGGTSLAMGGGSGTEGSGLGLAIVKRLVAADDGQVELRAAEPHGIDAVVRLRPA